ncbi:hydrogenase maturation protease [bacterium]|nr:hydrogenase maturation protease [bacterium]
MSMLPAPTLILCLGNEVLSDDGFGPVVASRLRELGIEDNNTEVIFASLAGFVLIDLLKCRDRVLVVDTICTGEHPAGTLRKFPFGVFTPSRSLTTSHQISLPTAIELGKILGCTMPAQIDVLAVEAEDVETLQEELTPAVAGAVEDAVEYIKEWLVAEFKEVENAREYP